MNQKSRGVFFLRSPKRRRQLRHRRTLLGDPETGKKVFFNDFRVSHQGASGRCCLRRFGDLRKNTSLEFWSMYLVDFVIFYRFQGPPSPVRLCRSCLRRFGDLKKNTPLDFWSMYLAYFVIFNDFRAPPALCVCVAAACGASATSNKNTPLEFWSMYLVDLIYLLYLKDCFRDA